MIKVFSSSNSPDSHVWSTQTHAAAVYACQQSDILKSKLHFKELHEIKIAFQGIALTS